MRINFSISNSQQTFSGNNPKHAARQIGAVMNSLYNAAYKKELYPHTPDIIQITTKMDDGTEISAVANFVNGRFEGLSFPYEDAHYRTKFCKKILETYNRVLTKGKSDIKKRGY